MKYQLGDSVRITATPSRLFDHVGTVSNVDRGAAYPFEVRTADSLPLWFGGHELVLAERPVVAP